MKKMLIILSLVLSVGTYGAEGLSTSLGYNLTNSAKFDVNSDSGPSTTLDGSFSGHVRYLFDVNPGNKESLFGGVYLTANTNATVSDRDAKYSSVTYGLMGKVNLDNNFYLMGSLGLSSIDTNEDVDYDTGLELSIGLGHHFTEQMAVEVGYHRLTASGSIERGDSSEVDYDISQNIIKVALVVKII